MNSQRVTNINFNSPLVTKPQVVGIEIELSEKCRLGEMVVARKTRIFCAGTSRSGCTAWYMPGSAW